MIDATGTIVVTTRSHPAVSAIVGVRVGPHEPGLKWAAPMVIVVGEGTSRAPFGPESIAIGLQRVRSAARCYGTTYVQADQLARVVSDLWHERRPFVGSNGLQVHRAWADLIAPPVLDPDNKKPYATVYIDLVASVS